MMKLIFSLRFFVVFIFLSCEPKEGAQLPSGNVSNKTEYRVRYEEAGVFFIRRPHSQGDYTSREMEGIPTVEIGENGELFAGWHANKSILNSHFNSGEGPGTYITLSVSSDKAVSWKSNELIIAPIGNDRLFEPILWRDKFGITHLFWTKSRGEWWDGEGGVWETSVKYQGDSIFTTPPRLFIPKGIMATKPIFSLSDNDVYYITYCPWTDKSITLKTYGNFIFKGGYDNNGQIINPNSIAEIPVKTVKTIFSEPKILFKNPDTLLCAIRTEENGVFFSYSLKSSLFKKWTPFERYNALGKVTSSRFALDRLSSNNVLFVTNDDASRTNMTAFLSLNNGLSFDKKLLLDRRKDISYPDMTEDSNGDIYIIYDRERTGAKDIILVKITEKDILNRNSNFTVTKIN